MPWTAYKQTASGGGHDIPLSILPFCALCTTVIYETGQSTEDVEEKGEGGFAGGGALSSCNGALGEALHQGDLGAGVGRVGSACCCGSGPSRRHMAPHGTTWRAPAAAALAVRQAHVAP